MEEMQMTAIVLTAAMTAILLWQLPKRVEADAVTNRSRRLMALALGLLSGQFAAQYALGLRSLGVTWAVALNLAVFMPCSVLLAMSVLNLLRQGAVRRREWAAGAALCAVAAAVMAGGWLTGGEERLALAEVGACVAYMAMQVYYTRLVVGGLRHTSRPCWPTTTTASPTG